MVQYLKEKYKNRFGVYGNNWNSGNGSLMGDLNKEVDCYRGCKIAVNLSHFDYDKYSSDRIFRMMGTGAFCLTKWYPKIEEDFIDGVHLRVWKTFEELSSMVDYYLAPQNQAERRGIAEAGQYLVSTKHTWETRLDDLTKIIN